jgi:hypothetical protein
MFASNGFAGAQPKIVKNKPKYNDKENSQPNNQNFSAAAKDQDPAYRTVAFNIMNDKRVFRGNTHGIHSLRQPA